MRAAKFWIGFIIGFVGVATALRLAVTHDQPLYGVLLSYTTGAVGGTLVWKALNDD